MDPDGSALSSTSDEPRRLGRIQASGLMQNILAALVIVLSGETDSFLEYQADGLGCWLRISAPSGVIESLAVACQP